MANTQELIFTVVPFGMHTITVDGNPETFLNFSLVITPRLHATVADQVLGNYPDWAVNGGGRTWPETIQAVLPSMRLNVPGLPGTPVPLNIVGAHPPNATMFASIFPETTKVTPFLYQGFENRKIRSAPVGHLSDAIQAVYGRFGFESPTSFPSFKALADVTAFGPMGFQQTNGPRLEGGQVGIPGIGEARKHKLNNALETALAASKAVPYDLTAIAAATGVQGAFESLVFLQHLRFLNRNLPKSSSPTTSPPPPDLDFHQMVAGLGSLPTLLRVLGIVVDLEAGPFAPTDIPAAGLDLGVSMTTPSGFTTPTTPTLPVTMAHVAPGLFKPIPKNAANSDHIAKMLKIGNPNLYRVVRVDHDTAALKAIQFGNNLTRSRKGAAKQTPFTPDDYAMPALRTGGFAIARSGRATQMVAILARQTADLQNGGSTPTLYEDDLVRGYRFDVLDVADGIWRSVMWRHGTVTVNGVAVTPSPILEEDTVVPSPTSQGDSSPNPDLYLQETLTRWDGWSMAVPRIGKPFLSTDPSDPAASGSSGFSIVTEWHVPGEITNGTAEGKKGNAFRLPRLRFGRSYRFRARIADLAGNSLPVADAPHSGVVITPELRHLRFEPLPAPRAVLLASGLRQPTGILRAGDSDEVVVVRSESATVDAKSSIDNKVSVRLLLPGRTSVIMAEQHSAFDMTSTGKPMDPSVFTDIATRDATPLFNNATLLDGTTDPKNNSTENPWLYPDFLTIGYLADVVSPSAWIRNLPLNAFKKTAVELPFDVAKNGWPDFQAVRVALSRGPQNTWTGPTVVPNTTDPKRTTELELTLAKGYDFTTLVNSGITADTLDKMALWEWIQEYAAKHNKSTAELKLQILAGKHWMFTPWRQVRFVHAVRTPLLNPVLLFEPNKSAIGQTFALFHGTQANPRPGTIKFSRRSTAKVDIEASWSMPIDTGTNDDPVTPQAFQAHAFSLEPARDGQGFILDPSNNVIPTVDAENLNAKHEFNDTKFRSVTYDATATSFYVEFFRESRNLSLSTDPIADLKAGPVQPGVAFEASTVQLVLHWTVDSVPQSRLLTPAPPGTDPNAPAPVPGDYVVTEDPHLNGANPDSAIHGTVQVLANSSADSSGLTNAVVEFSYVGPTIHTFSNPTADKSRNLVVPNSARPKAPDVLYVLPIYKRTPVRGGITRTGGGLRVYLNRPWWSSGDQEKLGVVCWHPKPTDGTLPPNDLAPYVTQWGFDPVFQSTGVPAQPSPACFPRATASSSNGSLTIEEASEKVDVAGHEVGFDSTRNLWYCDLRVTDTKGNALTSYTPFIKLALARYQPHSIAGAHLSRIVQVDYAQLAPDRHVTVTGTGGTRTVTVVGRSPRATWQQAGTHLHSVPNTIIVLLEEKDTRIPDDELAWNPRNFPRSTKNTHKMTASTSGKSDLVTWQATVSIPTGRTGPLRLAFEEYEQIEGSQGGGRLAYTETINL